MKYTAIVAVVLSCFLWTASFAGSFSGRNLSNITEELTLDASALFLKSDLNKIMDSMIEDYSRKTLDSQDCKSIERFFKQMILSNTFGPLFGDLCNIVFRYDVSLPEEKSDISDMSDILKMKLAINNHLDEDGSHMEMFRNDWKELNLDNFNSEKYGAIDLLSHWFSKEMSAHRESIYTMMRLDGEYNGMNDPITRYVIVLMIEHSGVLLFSKQAEIYNIYKSKCVNPVKLTYSADDHSDVETGELFLRDERIQPFKQLFDDYVVKSADKVELLLSIGKEAAQWLESIVSDQFTRFIVNGYKQQDLWIL